MPLRPAKCYKKLERPYVRQSQRRPEKGYVKGVPESKIHRFEAGNKNKEFSGRLYLIAKMHGQIRSNALEAARVAANKVLAEALGEEGFYMKVLIYPHHVLRENMLATGAGADRFQTGMRQSFGKPIGVAARTKAGQELLLVMVDKSKMDVAKKALKVASSKIPVTCKIV